MLKNFEIQFVKLSYGVHDFTFDIDDKFFEAIEGSVIDNGKFTVHLTFEKQENVFHLNFKLEGSTKVECDRCLKLIDFPLKGSFDLMVKITDQPMEDEDDIIYLPRGASEINLAPQIYDLIVLSMPMQKTCDMVEIDGKKGQCDQEVIDKLKELKEEDPEPDTTDPRWDKLKKFIN